MSIVLYAKPQCVQCDATKRDLNSRKIEHETVDLTQNPDALSKVKEMGYQRAPGRGDRGGSLERIPPGQDQGPGPQRRRPPAERVSCSSPAQPHRPVTPTAVTPVLEFEGGGHLCLGGTARFRCTSLPPSPR